MKKTPLTQVVTLGSVSQVFHEKYLDTNGNPKKPYMDVARKAHKMLECLEDDCIGAAGDISITDALHSFRQKSILQLKDVLHSIETGSFTFRCEELCKHHPDCGGICDADLTDEKTLAMPGARNCAKFREEQGDIPTVRATRPTMISRKN